MEESAEKLEALLGLILLADGEHIASVDNSVWIPRLRCRICIMTQALRVARELVDKLNAVDPDLLLRAGLDYRGAAGREAGPVSAGGEMSGKLRRPEDDVESVLGDADLKWVRVYDRVGSTAAP